MPDNNDVPLSMSDAFDKGVAETSDDKGGEGGSGNDDPGDGGSPTGEGDEPGDGQPPTDKKPDGADPEKPGDKPGDKDPADKGTKKEPVVDPDKGVYDGEYTKERFNGLMSQWQKDRAAALRVPELERQVAEITKKLADPETFKPKPPEGQDDFEFPPELANADEDTKTGFKLFAKAIQGKFLTPQKAEELIQNMLTKPQREQNELVTKVKTEIEGLTAEFGDDFSKNEKAVRDFAIENEYPLGTLRQAYKAWKRIAVLEKGTKINKEIDDEKKIDADIPGSGQNRGEVIPKFDPTRDGGKSYDDIWEEAKQSMR